MESDDNSDLEQLIDTASGDATHTVITLETSTPASAMASLFSPLVNSLVHCLIAVNAFVLLWFASTTEAWSKFQLHIIFCGIGYQILMGHGILSMYPANSWSAGLSYSNRRRAHWVLQLVGSGLAIAGSIIMCSAKEVHFQSIHGKLALAAMIFTAVSLLNGLSSLYAAELRRFLPPAVSKFSHVTLGTAAFTISMACLCFGYLKRTFQAWSSETMAFVMISITVISTALVIFVPAKKVLSKVLRLHRS